MQKLVFVNGNGTQIDLTSGNFGITNWAGLSNVPLNIQTQQVPFEDGGVFLDALMEQREIEVTVAVYDGNNLELRYQKKRELISALNPKLGEGTLIYTNDYLSRQIKAVPQIPLFENKNSNDVGTLKASVVFSCCNPYWEDVEETSVELRNGETTVINNEGDILIGVEISEYMFESNELAEVRNITNQESITLQDSKNNNLVSINTKVGQKSVEGLVYNFKETISVTFKDLLSKDGRIFVVGENGLVAEIKDGYAIIKNLQTTQNFISIQYFEAINKYIVIGETNVYASTDFNTWEVLPITFISSSDRVTKIKFYNDKFFVVTSSYELYVSDDLTSGTNIPLNSGCVDIIYTNQYVVITPVTGAISTSSDLISWNDVITNIRLIKSICYHNGVYYVMEKASGYNDRCFSSSNLTTWTRVDSTFERLNTTGIEIVNNMLIVTTDSSSYYSVDFLYFNSMGRCQKVISKNILEIYTINAGIVEQGTVTLRKEIYSAEVGYVYCILESLDNEMLLFTTKGIYKTDSINKTYTLISNQIFDKCIYCKKTGNYYAVGASTNIYYSNDLINWTSVALNIGAVKDVVFDDKLGQFLAIGSSDRYVSVSEDGEHWTRLAIGYSSTWNHVYSNKGSIVIIGSTVIATYNGTSFSSNVYYGAIVMALVAPTDFRYNTVLISGNRLRITTGNENATMITSDITDMKDVIYSDSLKLYIAIATSGKILISVNGTQWTQIYSNSQFVFNSVFFINGKTYISGYFNNSGIILQIDYKENENLISNISQNSRMDLKLEIGENELSFVCNNGFCNIKYRQKYIGV